MTSKPSVLASWRSSASDASNSRSVTLGLCTAATTARFVARFALRSSGFIGHGGYHPPKGGIDGTCAAHENRLGAVDDHRARGCRDGCHSAGPQCQSAELARDAARAAGWRGAHATPICLLHRWPALARRLGVVALPGRGAWRSGPEPEL